MIHVVARSKSAAETMLRRHPSLKSQIQCHFDISSYFEFIQEIIKENDKPICVVHDDVFLPSSFLANVKNLVEELNEYWPNWGVCGNAGVVPFKIGQNKGDVIRYMADPHGGPNAQGMVLPAQSIDGNVMLLNCSALKSRNMILPKMQGFQFYDIALCISTLAVGRAILVAPQLSCYHDSKGSQKNFDEFISSDEVKEFLSSKICNIMLRTINGTISSGIQDYDTPKGRIDVPVDALSLAAFDRHVPKTAIIIRTQFKDPVLLRRSIEAAVAFSAAAGNSTLFSIYIISNFPDVENVTGAYDQVKFIFVELPYQDTRNYLVSAAFEYISADWYWFVDDDDWLFPNEAAFISNCLAVVPPTSLVLVGSQHFFEGSIRKSSNYLSDDYTINAGRYFDPSSWHQGISGFNHIPFCGMLVSADVYSEMDATIFSDITYFEDYALQMSALSNSKRPVIVIDKLCVGISVRPEGNTITEVDRSKWNTSLTELTFRLCNDSARPYLYRLN